MSAVEAREGDALASPQAASAFWRTLDGREPAAAVPAICDALAQLISRHEPHMDRLRALFALDRHVQSLLEEQLYEFAVAPLDTSTSAQQVRHRVQPTPSCHWC